MVGGGGAGRSAESGEQGTLWVKEKATVDGWTET